MASSAAFRDDDVNDHHLVMMGGDNNPMNTATTATTSTVSAAPPLSSFRNLSGQQEENDLRMYSDNNYNDNDDEEEGQFVDEPIEDFHAEEDNVHDNTLPSGEASKLPRRRGSTVVLLMILMAVLAALLVGIFMTVNREKDTTPPTTTTTTESGASSSENDGNETLASNITVAPSLVPINNTITNITNEQLQFMTYSEQLEFMTYVAIALSGQDAIDDSDSAASKALNWLLYEDPFHLVQQIGEIAPLDIEQRYVGAVLYFAMMDNNSVRKRALQNNSNSTSSIQAILFDNFLTGTDVCFWNTLDVPQGDGGVGETGQEERGILCNDKGIITELQFQNAGVGGYLPQEIGHLSSLEILDIRNCSLIGLLPPELSNLGEHLQYVRLSNNGISGPLPSSFGALTSLKVLDLAFNDLTGELSPELGNLNVESAWLNGNDFSGSFDDAFCADSPMQDLVADCLDDNVECRCCTVCCDAEGLECKATGPGPDGNTVAPEVVDERMAKLQTLLEPISGAESLEDPESDHYKVLLWMAQSDPNPQDLDNTDPVYIIQKYVLILIFISTNGIGWKDNKGWLSESSFCSWDGISCNDGDLVDAINLGNQNCRGTLATEIGALNQTLRALNLKNNPLLTGFLPSEIGMLTALSSLDVGGSQFRALIPPEIGQLSNLIELNVENNQLSGPIPSEIASLSQLKFISLSSNDFTGKIPIEFGTMESLVTLAANHNRLSSTIPPQLGTLSTLSTLDLSQNLLVGGIPSDLGAISLLENLYLNDNPDITGTVPQGLAFLSNLKEIYIHGTGILGNLDLLFCTGEVEQVTANCLDPLVIRTCCSICCDASGESCEKP